MVLGRQDSSCFAIELLTEEIKHLALSDILICPYLRRRDPRLGSTHEWRARRPAASKDASEQTPERDEREANETTRAQRPHRSRPRMNRQFTIFLQLPDTLLCQQPHT